MVQVIANFLLKISENTDVTVFNSIEQSCRSLLDGNFVE